MKARVTSSDDVPLQLDADGPMSLRRQALALLAGSLGQVFEWYDFALFGLLAEQIGAAFFPSHDKSTEFLAAFAVYGTGFVMRQVGGVLFGVIGDRMGRLVALRISIVAMLVPAIGIVFLPPYQSCEQASSDEGEEEGECVVVLGVLASVLLVLLRLVQGVSVGGELVGAITYSLECAGQHRRGLLGAFIQISGSIGGLLATSVVAVTRASLTASQFAAWGWRVPFAVGLVLPVGGLLLRRSLRESPAFIRMRQLKREMADASAQQQQQQQQDAAERRTDAAADAPPTPPTRPPPSNPLCEMLRSHKAVVGKMTALSLLWQAGGYVTLVWVPAYLSSLRQPPVDDAFALHVGVYLIYISSMLLSGAAADRFGARRMMLAGTVGSAVAFPTLMAALSPGAGAGDAGCLLAHGALAHVLTRGKRRR